MPPTRFAVRGRPLVSPRERRLAIAFALAIVTVYLLSVVAGWLRTGTPSVASAVLEPLLYPVLYFYAPPVLAAYNDLRGGSAVGGLLLGAIPGLTFPLLAGVAMAVRTGPADTPAWVMTLTFVTVGVVAAGVGVAASRALRWVDACWRNRDAR